MSLLPSSFDSSTAEEAEPRIVGVESDEADEIFAALSSGTARKLLMELHDEPAPPAELADRVGTSVQNAQYHLDKLEAAGAIEIIGTAYSEKGREMNVYAPADQPLVIFAGDEEENALRTALSRLLGSVGLLALGSVAVQSLFGDQLLPFTGTPDAAPADEEDADVVEDEAPADDTVDAPDEVDDDAVPEESPEEAEVDDAPDEMPADDEADVEEPSPEFDSEPQREEETLDSADGLLETVAEEISEGFGTLVDVTASLPPGLLFFIGGLFVCTLVIGVLYHRDVSGD